MTQPASEPTPAPEPHERYRWERRAACAAPGGAAPWGRSRPRGWSARGLRLRRLPAAGPRRVRRRGHRAGDVARRRPAGRAVAGLVAADGHRGRRRRACWSWRSRSACASSARLCGRSRSSPTASERLADGEPERARPAPRPGPGPRPRRLVQRDGRAPRPVARRPPGAARRRHPRAPDAAHRDRRRPRGDARRRPPDGRGPRLADPRRGARHGPAPRRPPDDLARRGGGAAAASGAGRPRRPRRTTSSPVSGRSPRRSASSSCAVGDAALEAVVDPVRVREILVNLVANAVRHTDRWRARSASTSGRPRPTPC